MRVFGGVTSNIQYYLLVLVACNILFWQEATDFIGNVVLIKKQRYYKIIVVNHCSYFFLIITQKRQFIWNPLAEDARSSLILTSEDTILSPVPFSHAKHITKKLKPKT